jgi:hypothetical protein
MVKFVISKPSVKTMVYKRHLILVIFLILFVQSYAQKGINGKFVFSPGIGATVLILKDDFTYRSFVYSCLDDGTDTGRYEFDHDTIKFHTFYTLKDFHSRPLEMNIDAEPNKNNSSDSIMILGKNSAGWALKDISIKLNGKEIAHIDSINSYSECKKVVYIKRIEPTTKATITVSYDTISRTQAVEAPAYLIFSLMIDYEKRHYKREFDEKFLYKGDSFYFLNNKNHTYKVELGDGKEKDAVLTREIAKPH